MKVDAIVNAANTALQRGGGVCGAIFSAAGIHELQKECDAIGGCKMGHAVITKGYRLSAKYVIHTPGPIWNGGGQGEPNLLRSCYLNSLALAKEHGCESIAFPLISSGIFGYPKDEALGVAIAAISGFLTENEMMVYLVVFDKKAFILSKTLRGEVEAFIDENYIGNHDNLRRRRQPSFAGPIGRALRFGEPRAPIAMPALDALDDFIGRLDEPFSRTLLRLIGAKGKTEAEVYKRANIDRRHFSKIRGKKNYTPSKKTILALAVALELSMDETTDLLKRAGYALSRSQLFDVIVEYFITIKKYDIFKINEALFDYDQPLLGS
jgi:O-acetyl-ADP-ribose deacetylase (regulator of RNase III)/transcriptional regulator with XRE-family HTH domain